MDKKLLPYKMVEVFEKVEDYIPEGVQLVHASDAWEKASYGEGIVIAVIDTGIDRTHPDLQDRIIGGRDFTGTGDFQDDNGHGTHVSGTILANLNQSGIVGVAPSAKVLALKALNGDGQGESQWINAAIDYATNWTGPNGERVSIISMSLGGPPDAYEHRLIQKAVQNNILVVCAAGNSGDGRADTDELAYPGAYPEVVEVGAVDLQKNIAEFSNTNGEVDIVAPGVGILSTYPGGRYAKLSGTSMATPHVSGAAALIKNVIEAELNRNISEAELYAQLCKNTEDLRVSKKAQGNGVLNLSDHQESDNSKKITITINPNVLLQFIKSVLPNIAGKKVS